VYVVSVCVCMWCVCMWCVCVCGVCVCGVCVCMWCVCVCGVCVCGVCVCVWCVCGVCVRVFVALAMRMRRFILSSLAFTAVPFYFLHYLINGTIVGKTKLLNIRMCFYRFSLQICLKDLSFEETFGEILL